MFLPPVLPCLRVERLSSFCLPTVFLKKALTRPQLSRPHHPEQTTFVEPRRRSRVMLLAPLRLHPPFSSDFCRQFRVARITGSSLCELSSRHVSKVILSCLVIIKVMVKLGLLGLQSTWPQQNPHSQSLLVSFVRKMGLLVQSNWYVQRRRFNSCEAC